MIGAFESYDSEGLPWVPYHLPILPLVIAPINYKP